MNVSVVIPTKNNIDTIEKCLASLMPYYNEGYISEIVVVDGHSTDGTLEVFKKYPVTVLSDEGKKNPGLAYDIGWRNAKGEIIMFVDSDVYLMDGFFPKILKLFSDTKIGLISCYAKAVVSNKLSKIQADEWVWGAPAPDSKPSRLQSLYKRLSYGGSQKALCGGPLMVVRRVCLEAINGHHGLSYEMIRWCSDIAYSQRIANKGWEIMWWYESPVYHYPRDTFKGLNKQFYVYGKSIAYFHMWKEFQKDFPWQNKVISLTARFGSPLIGIYLAIRYLNPYQLIVYPLPRFYWVWGYIRGWIAARKPDQPVYSEPGINPSK